jgi:hypothetical protein
MLADPAPQSVSNPVTAQVKDLLRTHCALTCSFSSSRILLHVRSVRHEVSAGIEALMLRAVEDASQDNGGQGRTVHLARGDPARLPPASPPNSLADHAFMFKTRLQAVLRNHTIAALGREMEVTSVLPSTMASRPPTGTNHARGRARGKVLTRNAPDLETLKLSPEFRDILTHDQLTVLFQPIHDFKTGNIMVGRP